MAARLMAITSLNTCGGPNHASPPEIDEPVAVEFIAFIGIAAKALGSGLRHLAFCARFRGHLSELVVQVDWVAGWGHLGVNTWSRPWSLKQHLAFSW